MQDTGLSLGSGVVRAFLQPQPQPSLCNQFASVELSLSAPSNSNELSNGWG